MSLHSALPTSLLRSLAEMPAEQPVAMLMRHAARPPIPNGETGHDLPITEQGRNLSVILGRAVASRLRSVSSSPVRRCLQTGRALGEGAGLNRDVIPDTLLGDPGVYVLDPALAWKNWQRLGHEGVTSHLLTASQQLPGMAVPDQAAKTLVDHMLDSIADKKGLHAFITHDYIVAVTASRLMTGQLTTPEPEYLEAAFFWREAGQIHGSYRDACGPIILPPAIHNQTQCQVGTVMPARQQSSTPPVGHRPDR